VIFEIVYLTLIMRTNDDLISLFILRQREAMYQLRRQNKISRMDMEVLAFSLIKKFITVFDAKEYYSHTNTQQIQRSLNSLTKENFLYKLSNGVKGKPSNYAITPCGKKILKNYSAIVLSDDSFDLI